jgi:hypothetical protein
MWMPGDNRLRRGRAPRQRALTLESLEGRALLSADYVLSGTQWPNPSHITYSIAPDGVDWVVGNNNLNATFNAEFGNGPWQRAIARALATWEDVANINIAQVGESGAWPSDTSGATQGDARFGDIRFGGANFNDNQTLAETYQPPTPGANDTLYGNVEINTVMPWHIGSDFDFYSVMLHETGLALGLSEPPPGGDVVMNTVYGGVRSGLMPGDIAGIQAMYGPRTPDAYQAQGQGTSAASAVDVTGNLGGNLQATLNNVSLSTIGDTEFFSIVVPSNGGSVLSVTASAAGISLLSPQVTILGSSGQVLAQQGNPSAWGDAVTAQAGGVVPGQRYVIAVKGATSDAFAAGAYRLQVSFPNGSPSHSVGGSVAAAVTAGYQEVLGRAPSAQELQSWTQQIQGGVAPQQMLWDLANSPEHEEQDIYGLYQTYLGRPADSGGLAVFTSWLSQGASLDNIAAALVSSPEFTAGHRSTSSFLNALYEDALQRAPDSAGMAMFTSWLSQGATRGQVAQALLGSAESDGAQVESAYGAVLGRAADPAGYQFFVGLLQAGQATPNTVFNDLFVSPENQAKLGFTS